MELIYFWIDKYKNLKNFGVCLHPAYEGQTDNCFNIEIKEKPDYINIFGDNINIITIVGQNGSGKSNLVNAISSVLRNISHNKKISDDYDDSNKLPKKCTFCIVIKNNNEYLVFSNRKNKFKVRIQQKEKKPQKITINENTNDFKAITAKFQPFYLKDETLPPEFPLWHGINDITKIKLKNYFYYDRYRLYDTVRNLIELYKFEDELNKINKGLEIFKLDEDVSDENKEKKKNRLYFNGYSPYVDLYEALQWANKRVQRENNYSYSSKIAEAIGNSVRTFSSNVKKHRYNTFDDLFEGDRQFLQKLFFIYALGEILSGINHKKLKFGLIQKSATSCITKLIENLNFDSYDKSENRINFYEELLKKIQTVRIREMLQSYIEFENDKGKSFKNYLRTKYKIIHTEESTILRLKKPVKTEDIIKNKSHGYVKEIERLKGISKNLYICDENTKDTYDFMSLSTGEQRFMRFFADLYLSAATGKNKPDIFLFDEMDLSWHPEWQRNMILYIHDLFNKMKLEKSRKITLIFSTHSPFILSDMPKENVIYMKNGKIKTDSSLNPFGANIHELFLEGMFFNCDGCTTRGEFVQRKIKEIKDLIETDNSDFDEIEQKINMLGEPVIKNMLFGLLYQRKEPSLSIENLKLENKKLREKLKKYEKT